LLYGGKETRGDGIRVEVAPHLLYINADLAVAREGKNGNVTGMRNVER
jgi:hypothetical protein